MSDEAKQAPVIAPPAPGHVVATGHKKEAIVGEAVVQPHPELPNIPEEVAERGVNVPVSAEPPMYHQGLVEPAPAAMPHPVAPSSSNAVTYGDPPMDRMRAESELKKKNPFAGISYIAETVKKMFKRQPLKDAA